MSKFLVLVNRYQKDLEKINNQRHAWLYASSVTFVGIIFLIFYWEWLDGLHSKVIWWVIISCMLIVAINWWYWTMRIIRMLIKHQRLEYQIIKSILIEISEFKRTIADLKNHHLDKLK